MYLFFINKKDQRRREGFKKEMYTPHFLPILKPQTNKSLKNLYNFAKGSL